VRFWRNIGVIWRMEARLVPHVMANFTTISTACGLSYTFTNRGRDSVVMVGVFLRRLGRWVYEYEVRVFHFRITDQVSGKEHPSTLMSMNDLAGVLSDQGKHDQAEEVYRRTLELSKTVLGKKLLLTLASMSNLAFTIQVQGRNIEAIKLMTGCVQLRSRVLGARHPSTLSFIRLTMTWCSSPRLRSSSPQGASLSIQLVSDFNPIPDC
jgi:hypothetical protein